MLPSRGVYEFLGGMPADFYAPPPGPMMFFDHFPSEAIFRVLQGLLIGALISLFLGFKTKSVSILTGLLLLTIKGFVYSLGKINHDILLAVVPLVMAFSGWGGVYSIDAIRADKSISHAQSWTLTLLALILGFMMFTAGLPKILGGWLDIHSHAAQGHFFKQYFVRGRQDLLASQALNINATIWECMDYLTVLFETSFLLAIFHTRSTRIYICFAVLFHFSLMMILNISFLPNFVAYAAFLNWDHIDRFIKSRFSYSKKKRFTPFVFGAVLSALFTAIILLENGTVLNGDWGMPGVVIVTGSVPIALYYLFKQAKCYL